MKQAQRQSKRETLRRLLQGDTNAVQMLQNMTLDLDQFTVDELEQLRLYQQKRDDGMVDIRELEDLFGRSLTIIPMPVKATF